jgi:hypothetical protein
MNSAEPTSGKIMLASLADALARESKTNSAATTAWVAMWQREKFARSPQEKLRMFDSTIDNLNP